MAQIVRIPDIELNWADMVPSIFTLTTNSSTLQTVVNITGRGVAFVYIESADSTARHARVTITRNGVVLSDFASSTLAGPSGRGMAYGGGGRRFEVLGLYAAAFAIADTSITVPGIYQLGQIGFTSSFLVQISTTSGMDVRSMVGVIA